MTHNLRCWLDDDGEHVWQAHNCVSARTYSMLPLGTAPDRWHAKPDGAVVPSIKCATCGMHEHGKLEPIGYVDPVAFAERSA